MKWYLRVIRYNYANFKGRASRQEYWMFALVNTLIAFGLSMIEGFTGIFGNNDESILANLYSLVVAIPSIAVGVRRMHDIGKSGWFLLIPIYNFILLVTDSDSDQNQYGEHLNNY